MSTNRAIAWNTAVQFAGKAISTAIGVVIVGLMTRYLGQDGFGMYSTANAYFQVFAIILDLGLNITLVQMLGEHRGDKAYEDRAASATFTFRLITAGILLSIAPFIALAFGYPPILKLAIFAIWGSFFFTVLNQIVIGVQQRHLKMHIVAIGEVAGRITLLCGVLAARAMGWGLVPIVLIVSLGGFVNFLINTLVARRYASLAWNWDPAFWKILLKRSWPIGVSIFFNLIYYKADTLILGRFRPFAEVGIYSAAYRVLDIFTTLPFMYMGVVLPILATAWATKDLGRFRSLLRNSYTVMLMLILPAVTGAFAIGDKVMRTVAGDDFAASGGILKILILAAAVIFFGTVSSHAVVALDLQRRMMRVYIWTAVIILACYLVLIPVYGMWAAAWLTVVSETLVAAGATYYTLKNAKTSLDWRKIGKTVLCAVVMGLAVLPIKDVWLPIPLTAGVLVYAALMLLTGAVSKETLKDLLIFQKAVPSADVT